jgi:arylsulfatase A-like enzyme
MPADRPNIVFIITDDQGPWAAGCYGNDEIRTPNLDRLAASGVRFENFFCSTPVCSASRASFLTGKTSSAHGVHDWIREGNTGPDATAYLEGQVAYTDILAANGYTCGLSGKWHLGASETPQHGFTHWFAHEKGGGDYNDALMVRDGKLQVIPGYVTTAMTDDALEFIDTNAAGPFYLGVHYTAPHSPWVGHPQDIFDSYADCPFLSCPQEPVHPDAGPLTDRMHGRREMLQGYFAAVTAMDADVGRLLDHLEESGLRDNTLVVFVSDNGFSCGQHGFWGKGNGTYPVNMYENSVKVPFVISHPERIPAGQVTDVLASAYDFMPTLLEYLGLEMPDDEQLPGRSFVPALMGEADPGNDAVIIYDEYGPTRMIRTHEWKYIHRYPDGPHLLYDLVNDPDERNNRVDSPGQAERIADLRGRLKGWFIRYVNPEKDGVGRRVLGRGQLRPLGGKWEDGSEAFEQVRFVDITASEAAAGEGYDQP